MNIEDTKSFLSRGLEIHKKIEKLEFKYVNTVSTGDTDPTVRGASHGNSTEFGFINHAHTSAEIDRLKMELDAVTREIYNYIRDNCSDAYYELILIRRYVYLETFSQISKNLGLSESYVYSLHSKGLKIIVQ